LGRSVEGASGKTSRQMNVVIVLEDTLQSAVTIFYGEINASVFSASKLLSNLQQVIVMINAC
jgi:hypothetical protein